MKNNNKKKSENIFSTKLRAFYENGFSSSKNVALRRN